MKFLKILFLGDIVGQPGLRALRSGLDALRKRTGAQIVAVNGENMADGHGLAESDVECLFSLGISVVTSGNHIWNQNDIFSFLESESRLLRPINYPSTVPGHGATLVELSDLKVGFINIIGQIKMGVTVDCPFKTGQKAVDEMRKQTKIIIVDFHAEDVREKEAMAYSLDGQVSAVLGTHTHVPTADARILSKGTAALTDLGMCGPIDSVIGSVPEISIRRCMTQLPLKMEVLDSPGELNGVLLNIDSSSGKAVEITRVSQEP